MDKVTTSSKSFVCIECDNELSAADGMNKGDYFECDFCGIEYEVLEVTPEGEYSVKIVEEEK